MPEPPLGMFSLLYIVSAAQTGRNRWDVPI